MLATSDNRVHGKGATVIAQPNKVLEPLQQLRVLAEERRADLDELNTVDDLLVVEAEAAEEVLIHLVVFQRLAHLVKESIVTERSVSASFCQADILEHTHLWLLGRRLHPALLQGSFQILVIYQGTGFQFGDQRSAVLVLMLKFGLFVTAVADTWSLER